MNTSVKCIQWGLGPIRKIAIYPSLSSTNAVGKEKIKDGCDSGTVLWALRQTDGRGRQGRSWDGGDFALTFSLLWHSPPEVNLGILPLTVGLGLVQSLGFLVPGLKVKWPNDLYFGGRKLGGILVETVQSYGPYLVWVSMLRKTVSTRTIGFH